MATKTLSTVRKATKLQVQRHKAKTLRKDFGVLVGDRLVFQSESYSKAHEYTATKGVGCVVNFHGMTDAHQRQYKRERREREAMKNPLAGQLFQQRIALIEMIHDIGAELYEVSTHDGIVMESELRGEPADRRATDDEAAKAEFGFYANVQFDLRGSAEDVAASAAASLRTFARDLMARARAIELASKRGKLPKPVKHHYVRRDGECVYGPFSSESRCRAFTAYGKRDGEVIRVFEDGTEAVRSSDDTIFS